MRYAINFNPRAPCGARPLFLLPDKYIEQGISTHAPLAGRDVDDDFKSKATGEFQPTRPLRGATGTVDVDLVKP